MDNTGQLINYIVQELKRGVPEASIRSTLLQNGWPTEPVNRAFSMLSQSGPVTAAAELPPVSNSNDQPAPQPVQIRQERIEAPRRNRSVRQPLVVGLILLLLAAAAFGIFTVISNRSRPANIDEARKDTLNSLADKLAAYYTANSTYPALSRLNSPGFASEKDGFDISEYRDPSWERENTKCKDKEGRAILLESRAKDCYAYRVTAPNGDVCNGESKKCTRMVLTATLGSDKPYIVGLDQNKKEKY